MSNIHFNVGQSYTREQIYNIVSVPKGQRRGNWETGYTRWKDDLFIFSTVGSAATDGFDYDNEWESETVFRWYAKNGTHLEQPLIRWMLKEAKNVYIFTRPAIMQPFTFKGLAKPIDYKATSPVEIRWHVSHAQTAAKAYLLTWTPIWDWPEYEVVVQRSAEGKRIEGNWGTGGNKSIQKGERVFLLRQRADRGIVGSGVTTSDVYIAKHWDGSKRMYNAIKVDFDRLVTFEDRLRIEQLMDQLGAYDWNHILGSGNSIPPDIAHSLEIIWNDHLKKVDGARYPEEVTGSQIFYEGATRKVFVNAYERNPNARAACIEHYKATCVVCNFCFGDFYGTIGDGYIHVHHLKALAKIGERYEVDPIADLRPVCPNCHAMLHKCDPPMSIEELQSTIEKQRKRKVVSK